MSFNLPRAIAGVVVLVAALLPGSAIASTVDGGGGSSTKCTSMPTTPKVVSGYIVGSVTLTCDYPLNLSVYPMLIGNGGKVTYYGTSNYCTSAYKCTATIKYKKPSATYKWTIQSLKGASGTRAFLPVGYSQAHGIAAGAGGSCDDGYIYCPWSAAATF